MVLGNFKRLALLAIILPSSVLAQQNLGAGMTVMKDIKLPELLGGFDLMAYNPEKRFLYVAATDNHSVEVFDLKNSRHIKSLKGFDQPKWCFYYPRTKSLFVSTSGDNKVSAIDANSFAVQKTFSFSGPCNNLRYDAIREALLIGIGKNTGEIGVIDLRHQRVTAPIPLAAYPKQFEILETFAYVNIPSKGNLQVVNLNERKVQKTWFVSGKHDNIPMCIDRRSALLYIGQASGKLNCIAMADGKSVGEVRIHKDVDGIYLDEQRSRLYVSCAEGYLDIIQLSNNKVMQMSKSIPTAKGAGTGIFIPSIDRYILAVPQTGANSAMLKIFKPN